MEEGHSMHRGEFSLSDAGHVGNCTLIWDITKGTTMYLNADFYAYIYNICDINKWNYNVLKCWLLCRLQLRIFTDSFVICGVLTLFYSWKIWWQPIISVTNQPWSYSDFQCISPRLIEAMNNWHTKYRLFLNSSTAHWQLLLILYQGALGGFRSTIVFVCQGCADLLWYQVAVG